MENKKLLISLPDIKAAVLGKSKSILVPILNKYSIPYRLLNKHDNITNENMVFCVNYYKIIPPSITDTLKYGVWIFHGSDLPKGRGWAPLAWTLINRESKFVLTLFKADGGMDTGMYFDKRSVNINETTTIYWLREKSYEMIKDLICSLFNEITSTGSITLHQQEGTPTTYVRRTPKDSELDINRPLKELWSTIRACHNDDYPAFFKIGDSKITLHYEVQKCDTK